MRILSALHDLLVEIRNITYKCVCTNGKNSGQYSPNCNDIKQDTWCNQNTSQIIPVQHLWGFVTKDFPVLLGCFTLLKPGVKEICVHGLFLVYIEVRYVTPSYSLFTYIMRSNYRGVSSFVEYLVYHHHVVNIIQTNDDTVSIKWPFCTF